MTTETVQRKDGKTQMGKILGLTTSQAKQAHHESFLLLIVSFCIVSIILSLLMKNTMHPSGLSIINMAGFRSYVVFWQQATS